MGEFGRPRTIMAAEPSTVNKTRSPKPASTESSARSFALQLSGGIDYRLSRHFAVRAIDLGYLHSALPNGNNNVQNNLRLGAGAVFRF